MAKLARVRVVDWTVLAAASLLSFACGATQGDTGQTGETIASGTPTNSGSGVPNAAAMGANSANTANNAAAGNGSSNTMLGGTTTSVGNNAGATGSTGMAPTTGATGNTGTQLAGTDTTAGATAGAGPVTDVSGQMMGSNGGSTMMAASGGTAASGGASNGGATGEDMATGGSMTDGSDTTDEVYNPDFVEFYGEDCEVSDPQEINDDTLPDLFAFFDGSRMSKKSEWRCRRAELKKAVETFIHGEKPGRPDTVTGTVSNSSISVHVEHGGKSIDFSVMLSIPGGTTGPVPAIIGLGGGSLDRGILSDEGVALINYNNNSLASETSRSGLFTDIYGNTGASAQVGWAWGVSRIIDVLVDERDAGRNDIIDPTAIGVTGCSRLGKGAFTIGAFDERIALGIPQESGTGGVSALRVVNTAPVGPNHQPAQSINSAWSEAQGWFGTVFGNYKDNVNVIPADTHSLVAMYAPRGLLVLDNSRIGELGSVAQHAATAAGGEVYKALGVEHNVAYHGGNADDPHNHCTFYPSQEEPLRRAIRGHLTRTAEPDGRMEPQPVATANLDEWIKWDTPTLE